MCAGAGVTSVWRFRALRAALACGIARQREWHTGRLGNASMDSSSDDILGPFVQNGPRM